MANLGVAAVAVMLITMVAGPAQAITISTLKKSCAEWLLVTKKEHQAGRKDAAGLLPGMGCRSYIRGVHDAKTAHDTVDGILGPYCLPGPQTVETIAAVFVKWASQNRKYRKLSAAVGILSSLILRFPCQRGAQANPSHLQGLTVRELTKRCVVWSMSARQDSGAEPKPTKLGKFGCKAYIRGAHESKLAHDKFDKSKGPYCLPDKTTMETTVDIYLRWARVHREFGDRPAALGLQVALKDKFPCSR